MASPSQLDFSSPGDDDTPSSSPSLYRRKPALTRQKKKNKYNNLASPVRIRIWSEEDELTILKRLVDHRAKTGFQAKIDWNGFCHFVQGSIVAKVSKEQILSKIKKLKRKFLLHMEKINQGKDPLFTKSSDSEAFGFSSMIWGRDEAELANGGMDDAQPSDSGEETSQEDDEAANAKPLNEKGASENYVDGKSPPHDAVVDKIIDKGKESHDESAADELCAVRDAFETMMSQGFSEYQRKLQLEKLMNLGTGKRKELSNEWKALCAEEVKLSIKRLRFSAKLAEAANGR